MKKTVSIKTTYIEEANCAIMVSQYKDGSLALRLLSEEGEPLCTCTVWVEGYVPPTPFHVLIKPWSENEGLANALAEAGIIILTGESVVTGFCEALEAIVNPDFI